MTDFNKFGDSWDSINPPGYYRMYLPGADRRECVVADLFDNHRFLFFSLLHGKKFNFPLDLVSIDYHLDLAAPSEPEKENLLKLNHNDDKEIAFFTWNHLNPLNDGHILSAVYLNLIGDVVILTKALDRECPEYIDKEGNKHMVHAYSDKQPFIDKVKTLQNDILLDIDLDYFVEEQRDDGEHDRIVYEPKDSDYAFLDSTNPMMQHLKGKLKLITIAKEPECCGGILNSNDILKRVSEKLFVGGLARDYHSEARLKIYE